MSYPNSPIDELASSILFDEATFYKKFIKDLSICTKEVIIESPYITTARMNSLTPVFDRLLDQGVSVFIMTRDPKEHSGGLEVQSELAIRQCEALGIQVLLCTGNHHRKLAILDRKVLWEGSLNILSQTQSREIMRRIESERLTAEMFEFLKLGRFI